MTTEQILQLDCREQKNREIIQKVLRKIRPLSKCPVGQDVPFEKLERCMQVLNEKYNLFCRELFPDTHSGDKYVIWRSTIINLSNLDTVGSAYGCTLYEVMAKTVIMLYAYTRKQETNGTANNHD